MFQRLHRGLAPRGFSCVLPLALAAFGLWSLFSLLPQAAEAQPLASGGLAAPADSDVCFAQISSGSVFSVPNRIKLEVGG